MSFASFELSNLFGVAGKVAVVTGGGTGIGRAITTALAVNGAKVFIVGRREDILKATAQEINESASRKGGEVIPITGNILTTEDIEEVFKKLSELTDKVDYLVNNAGTAATYRVDGDINNLDELEKRLKSVEAQDFMEMSAIHVSAPFLLAVKLLPLFAKSDDAAITNITSGAGKLASRLIIHPAYGSAKAAEIHLSKLMASNFIPFKIRVNSVAAGIYQSQMTTGGSSDPSTPVIPVISELMKQTPAGRVGKPEEIAGIVLVLASPAGHNINGADFDVDGGILLVGSASNI